jgi:hypothetical protein
MKDSSTIKLSFEKEAQKRAGWDLAKKREIFGWQAAEV